MSTPVFMLVLGKGFTEAWYQLSKQEQDDLWARVGGGQESWGRLAYRLRLPLGG